MTKLLELFDEFAKPTYVKWILQEGNEPHEFILVFDDNSKQATVQLNLFLEDGELIEVCSNNTFELYEAVMEYFRYELHNNSEKVIESFFYQQEIILEDYINQHIAKTFYNPNLILSVMQLDIAL